jgi:hypothetical protein
VVHERDRHPRLLPRLEIAEIELQRPRGPVERHVGGGVVGQIVEAAVVHDREHVHRRRRAVVRHVAHRSHRDHPREPALGERRPAARAIEQQRLTVLADVLIHLPRRQRAPVPEVEVLQRERLRAGNRGRTGVAHAHRHHERVGLELHRRKEVLRRLEVPHGLYHGDDARAARGALLPARVAARVEVDRLRRQP